MLNKVILKYFAHKMDGKKTLFGTIAKILSGLILIFTGMIGVFGYMFPDLDIPKQDIEISFASITGGLYAIGSAIQGHGIGHKIEKSANKEKIHSSNKLGE